MKSRKIRALIISLVICAIFTGGYYGYNKFTTNTKAATSNYKEVTAKKMNIEIGIQGTGSVYAGISKDIVPNNSGTIGDLSLKIGDKVEAGSKLFVSNSEDLINSMNTAQQNLDAKKLNLQDDTTSYNDSLAKANTAINETQNQLNSAKDAVNKMNVTSPISGTIVAVNNKNGDSVKINSISSSSGNEGIGRNGGSKPANTGISSVSTGAVLTISDKDNPSKIVQVLPNNDGVIKNLNVKVGDSIQAGQILFASDSDTVRQNVQKVQSNLEQQKSSLTDLKNSKKLEIDGLDISDVEVQLDAAKDAVNKMTVTSPISGLIVAVNKSNGDSVSGSSGTTQSSTSSSSSSQSSTSNSGNSNGGAVASNSSKSTNAKSAGGTTGGVASSTSTSNVASTSNTSTTSSASQTTDSVLTIVDPSSIKVKVAVDELDIAKIKEGQKAQIKFDAISDKVYEGAVETIPQNGTTTNGVTTYEVVVSIKETDGIKIGMSANVNILVDSKADTLAVPADAVIEKDDKKYVMDENHNLIEVKTGIENEKYIEILEGIREEEKLLST